MKKETSWLEDGQEPWCMFCGASVGEVGEAGAEPGDNRATAVYWCASCSYMYCSICSYRNAACAEAVCVRCDNLMTRISRA